MQPWILFGLLSALFAALVTIFAKIGLNNVDTTLATTIRALFMAIFLIIASAFTHKFNQLNSVDSRSLAFLVLAGLAGASSWLFYFMALKSGPTTSVAALDRLSIAIIFIISFLLLKEPFSLKALLGIVLIVAGTILTVK